jgi:hypothetical protein
MMNLLQVQDDLKNFSQDQLVKEMQQPSGSTPQFLVLSELNRRKRVKGDFEARQAQQQPTVAEEAVASAGVPQQGMMGMSEAMAPASMESGGIGSMMPKTMKNGGEIDRYADGGLIEGIADSVSQNADSLQRIQEATLQNSKLLSDQQNAATAQPQPAVTRPMPIQQPIQRPLNGFGGSPFNIGQNRIGQNRIGQPLGFGGKGPQRPGRNTYGRPSSTIAGLGSFADLFNKKPSIEAQTMAEGGVIKAQDGLPDEESYLSKFGSSILNFLQPDKEVLEGRIKESNPFGVNPVLASPATDATLEKMEEQEKPATTEEKKEDTDAIIKSEADKTAKEVSATPKTLTLEEELAKRQAGLDKDRNFDKYMALAQAGLGILASDKPTLAQAVGEGGMKGLDAFREANKRYEEGLTDILNARVKLKAAKKTGLSQKDAITAISSIDSDIAKLDENLTKEYDESRKSQILAKIAQLNFQKRGLMPLAGYSYLPQDVSDSAAAKG